MDTWLEKESTICQSTGDFDFLIAEDRAKQCFSFKGLIGLVCGYVKEQRVHMKKLDRC